MRIGFSHNYSKLHNQTSAKLLNVEEVKKSDLDPDFIKYDTDGVFDLKYDTYLKLLLIGNKGIPFTTLRRNVENLQNKYCKHIGEIFEIYVVEDNTVVAG